MEEVKVLEVKNEILKDNDEDAKALRQELKEKGIYLLNVMSSPGSGKTTTLIQLIKRLKKDWKIAVMEADIDSDVDAKSIQEKAGVQAIQLHTGGMCHLDAEMTRQGIHALSNDDFDLVVLENVGNLVCPAEYDTGASGNLEILSLPEGHDKPFKYPLVFSVCDLVVINKIDVASYFDFDFEACEKEIHELNPSTQILKISAKTGEGMDEFASYLDQEIRRYKENCHA